jgi:glycosyltransferase involved in cell wall biosynthesis
VRVLYLGRLERSKGVDLLCDAFAQSAATQPMLHLDVVGGGGLAPELRGRYGEHPQMAFHGLVLGEEKQILLQESDCLLVPSVWDEAFGLVTIEAFAAGTPVLASNVGALPELVRHGETGYILPAGDLAAWAEALSVLVDKRDELQRMRLACLADAQRYTCEQVVDQYVYLYERVLVTVRAPAATATR